MRTETIQYFSEDEEAFVDLLVEIGTRKNIAKLLVFLAGVPAASSLEIERGADMRQPEVSLALRYLVARGWCRVKETSPERRGRPTNIYELAVPLPSILDAIGEEKRDEARDQLALLERLREVGRG